MQVLTKLCRNVLVCQGNNSESDSSFTSNLSPLKQSNGSMNNSHNKLDNTVIEHTLQSDKTILVENKSDHKSKSVVLGEDTESSPSTGGQEQSKACCVIM